MHILDYDEVMTIRRRLASGELSGPDFGATEPLRPNGLSSAIDRQNTGHGRQRKYDTPCAVAATLFYGIVQNHPFENGNKRTALVSLLVSLQKNRIMLYSASEDDLYDMATQVADHSFGTIREGARDPDLEVTEIAFWLDERSRTLDRGDKMMEFKELQSQLESAGCTFGTPRNNYIKIYREHEGGELSVRIGYPKRAFEVDPVTIKRIRTTLLLDEIHGYDSGAFYNDSLDATVDGFVNTYRQLLDRLATA